MAFGTLDMLTTHLNLFMAITPLFPYLKRYQNSTKIFSRLTNAYLLSLGKSNKRSYDPRDLDVDVGYSYMTYFWP